MSKVLTTPWGPTSVIAIIGATLIYMNLSRRLGAVTKMRPYYRWFFLAAAFLIVSLVAHIIRSAAYLAEDPSSEWLLSQTFGLIFFHVPFFIGVIIDLILVWRYWSWLLRE